MLAMLLLADFIYVQAGEGLKWYAVDGATLTPKGALATPGQSPIYLRLSADGRFLYAAGRDRLLAFAVGEDGGLTEAGFAPSPGGPCYVDAHPSWVATANYGSGTTRVHALEVGRPGPAREFPSGAQSHATRFHGRHLYTLSVKERKITRFSPEDGAAWSLEMPGLGPRHIAFSGGFAFVVHERPIRVSSLKVDAEGRLEPIGDWPALASGAEEVKELAAAEIAASGRFVYASVRDFSKGGALNGLAAYAVDAASGALSWIEFTPSGGVSPRGFVIAPSGRFMYVLNELSKTLVTFRVDPESGRLSPAGAAVELGGSSIGIAYAVRR